MSNRLLKFSSIKFTLLFLFIFIIACSSNEDIVIDNDDDQITEEVEEPEEEIVDPLPEEPSEQDVLQSKSDLLQLLTENTLNNGIKKTWRVSAASIINSTGALDISNNSNILDDEFVFTSNNNSGEVSGTLEWKRRKGINYNAETNSSVANDNYSSPIELDFIINDSIEMVAPSINIIRQDENTLTGEIIDQTTNSKLLVSLIQKTTIDYKVAPSSISFKTFKNFNNITSYSNTTGFIGSQNTNSLYLAYRDDTNYPRVRRVYKYDLNTQILDSTEISFTSTEFSSSRLQLINDNLIVIGSGQISKMKNTLDSEVINYPYTGLSSSKNLSRVGSAMVDSEIYLVGGDISVPGYSEAPFIIRNINKNTYQLQDVDIIEESRAIAEGEIVDSDLYVFGGLAVATSVDELVQTGFKYNLDNGALDYFDIPQAMYGSNACRYENLIFVSGKTPYAENFSNFFFGVFDIQTNTLSEISISFDSVDEITVNIEGMTIINDTLYIALENTATSKIVVEYVDLNSL